MNLGQDFLHASSTYGKIIISEVYLPPDKKTIKSLKDELGGRAGGDKFIVHNILFKFALDDDPPFYGSDYASAKVAGHEIKGLIGYLNSGIPNLCFPLMALVDYRGFRLIAMSILPITKKTIVYGSNDYGRTIHASDEEMNVMMAAAAHRLNIKPHYAGLSSDVNTLVHSAGDLEGHRGLDGELYLLDFARVWPPETPKPGIRMAHLYRLLRPEFVRRYESLLCSDAFSGFIARQPGAKEHNDELREATRFLVVSVVPTYALVLTQEVIEAMRQGTSLETFRLTEAVHRQGINARYYGLLRQHTIHTDVRTLLFVEMASRVVKNTLRLKLRQKMRELKAPLEAPYRKLVVDYLNVILGDSEHSNDYWNTHIRHNLQWMFEGSLNDEESDPSFPIRSLLTNFSDPHADGKLMLFKRVTRMTGLKFTARMRRELDEHRNCWLQRGENPFDDTDLEQIGLRTKHTNIVARSQGVFFKMRGSNLWARDPIAANRFFQMAEEKFREALDTDPLNATTLCHYAEVITKFIEGENRNLSQIRYQPDDPKVQKAEEYYLRAIEANPMHAMALFCYACFLEKCGKKKLAENLFLRSLECDPNHMACLHEYGNFLSDKGDTFNSELFFSRMRARLHADVAVAAAAVASSTL